MTSLSPLPGPADPDDNLVRYFAIHTVAVQAEGGSPATIRLYDGRYKRFLTFLHEQGYTPPFEPELLNAGNVRKAAIWVRERSKGSRGGEHAARPGVHVENRQRLADR